MYYNFIISCLAEWMCWMPCCNKRRRAVGGETPPPSVCMFLVLSICRGGSLRVYILSRYSINAVVRRTHSRRELRSCEQGGGSAVQCSNCLYSQPRLVGEETLFSVSPVHSPGGDPSLHHSQFKEHNYSFLNLGSDTLDPASILSLGTVMAV